MGAIFSKKRVAIKTLGCKANTYDSEIIQAAFKDSHYDIVSFENAHSLENSADVYVVNTCTVTRRADRESRQILYKLRRQNPNAKIIATGCSAQIHPKMIMNTGAPDYVIGQSHKQNIPNLIDSNNSGIYVEEITKNTPVEFHNDKESSRTRTTLKIQDGCNSRCAFCVIYQARGPSRSLPPNLIYDQIHRLLEKGYREINLTGINLAQYGRDLPNKLSFIELLREIAQIPGDFRIRISSLDPLIFTKSLVDTIATFPKLCNYFHLSLQHSDDFIIRNMNRGYKFQTITSVISYIHETIPDACLGFDWITGFPGETDTIFANSLATLKNLPFTYIHVFPFSNRPGSKAVELPDHIDPQIIKTRAKKLRTLSEQKTRAFHGNFIGSHQRILIESQKNTLTGVTDNYIRVTLNDFLDCNYSQFINVQLAELKNGYFLGNTAR